MRALLLQLELKSVSCVRDQVNNARKKKKEVLMVPSKHGLVMF